MCKVIQKLDKDLPFNFVVRSIIQNDLLGEGFVNLSFVNLLQIIWKCFQKVSTILNSLTELL